MLLLLFLLASSFSLVPAMTPAEWTKYCKFNEPTFFPRNQPYIGGLGLWEDVLYVSVPFSADVYKLNYGFDRKFWANNTYDEANCKFVYVQAWYINCDATSCPLLTPGLYIGMLNNTSPLIIPDNVDRNCKQTYAQEYVTPVLPTFIDQRDLTVYAESYAPRHIPLTYANAITGRSEYDSRLYVSIPNSYRVYSAQQWVPYIDDKQFAIQVQIVGNVITSLPSPIDEAFAMFNNGTFPLLEWDTGKFGYLWYQPAPPSAKRATLKRSDGKRNFFQSEPQPTEINFKMPSSVGFM